MDSGIRRIEAVIDYIESDLTAEPDYNAMAAKMHLSVYEFRRIFSFLVGCPVSEYIRRRKLSMAALELMAGEKADILAISEKYGYATQSAFSRAFCEQHGFSPTACMKGRGDISLFTRAQFQLCASGGETVPFRLVRDGEFRVWGYTGVSDGADTCCCENVWKGFYESGTDGNLSGDTLYAVYTDQGGDVRCCIGEKSDRGQLVPAGRWACFRMYTVDDDIVNAKYSKVLYEWLPSANLKRNDQMPIVEVYPGDMSREGFEWEIRIPIE